MTYTEIQVKNGKKYYYRVKSVRKGKRVEKVREYLGVHLTREALRKKENASDTRLVSNLNVILTKKEKEELQRIQELFHRERKENRQNRYESFLAQFTYDSNAIEGNTLSLQETSFILFEKRTPQGKSLREINEALNHQKAFDHLLHYNGDITKNLICSLQRIIVMDTLREDLHSQIGKYRDVQVYIRGAHFVPPAPAEARNEMRKLLRWYTQHKKILHPLILAAYFHAAFESIHPFVDGNGRTGRLLLNFILHKHAYPMINISNERRLAYYQCLETARKGNLRKFVKFLYDFMVSTRIYY